MARTIVIALMVLIGVGLAGGEWLPVAGGTNGAQISVIEQGLSRTVVEVTLPGLAVERVTENGIEYARLTIPDEVMAVIEVGRPQVPKVSLLLAVPDGARVSAQATVGETVTYAVGNIYPLQEPQVDSRPRPPFTVDNEFYTQDVSFPGPAVSLIETGVWRDLAVANLQVYPVQVNPARGEVTVAKKVRVEVSHPGGAYPSSVPDWLYPIYGSFIDNFAELRLRPRVDYDGGVRYLVFCHQNYAANSLLHDSLLGWVRQRGYDTRVIVKSGFTAAEIKDSVRQEYDRHNPPVLQHVLLVGEFAEVPMGSYSGVGKSDFYYADIEPWPAGDNYPELNIARFSPESQTDLDNQVRKVLRYQREPDLSDDWLERMTFVAHREQYPAKYSGCVRGIYHMPKPYWQPVLDTIMGQFKNNTDVANAVNAGVGILAYRGHGYHTIWDGWCGTSWTNTDVEALNNGNKTPVTLHWACYCGEISTATCHAEAWMRKYPGGSVSALAATQASYTLPNHGQCSTLTRAMTDTWTITVPGVRDYAGPVFSIGGQMSYMDAYIAKYWPSSPYFYNIWMYLTLGDPAMPVWAGTPAAAVVSCPDSIPLGPYSLNVGVSTGGRPVENALVCAWRDGEFYAVGRTDASGNTTLSVDAATAGDVLLTVSEGHARHSTPGVIHTPILPYECVVTAGGAPPFPGQLLMDHDTGYCRLTVSAQGSIGYDAAADAGSGFRYPKTAASALFYGSFAVGNSEGYVADRHFGHPASGPQNADLVVVDSLRPIVPPVAGDQHYRGSYNDAGHPSPKGLLITQNSHQSAHTGYDDFVVMIFDITNNGASPVEGLYAGVFADFDVGADPSANVAASDEVRRFTWMRQNMTQNPTVGVRILEPRSFANLSVVDHSLYVYPDSAMTDGMKWRLLNGTIVQRNSNRPFDWSTLTSVGPFDLPVGDTYRLAVAFFGGADEDQARVHADSAQAWYNGNVGLAEGPVRRNVPAALCEVVPNPFTGRTTVRMQLPQTGRVRVSVVDVSGRTVATLAEGVKTAGRHELSWRPVNLAAGVYFVRVETPAGGATRPVLLTR